MPIVTNSSQYRNLKDVLDSVVTDKSDGMEAAAFYKKVYKVEKMDDAYVEDVETATAGVASELIEGEEIPQGDFFEGPTTRYTARKFGIGHRMSEEAYDDGKHEDFVDLAKGCKRAMYKTMAIDAAAMFNRATSSSYLMADGVSLASASHTLPGGGTFSNALAVYMTPSRAALVTMQGYTLELPDHDGLNGAGFNVTKVIGHISQWAVWDGIRMSGQVPESNANEVNVANRNSIGWKWEFIGTPFITSRSFWMGLTDAPNGFKWKNRKKPTSNTYTTEGGDVMVYKIKARWDRNNSDPGRSSYLGST